jgi:hypothetical protein
MQFVFSWKVHEKVDAPEWKLWKIFSWRAVKNKRLVFTVPGGDFLRRIFFFARRLCSEVKKYCTSVRGILPSPRVGEERERKSTSSVALKVKKKMKKIQNCTCNNFENEYDHVVVSL